MQNASTKLATSAFNYEGIEPGLADSLRKQAERIRDRIKKTIPDIIEIGRDLLAVQESIPYGKFGTWLRAEFGWHERTAQNWMLLATVFGDRSEIVSDLPQGLLCRLAAKSTPKNIAADVVTKLEQGDPADKVIEEAKRQIEVARQQRALDREKKRRSERASKRTLQRRELEKKEREEQRQREREQAEAIAAKLIAQIGYPAIVAVLEALGAELGCVVGTVLREKLCAEPPGHEYGPPENAPANDLAAVAASWMRADQEGRRAFVDEVGMVEIYKYASDRQRHEIADVIAPQLPLSNEQAASCGTSMVCPATRRARPKARTAAL